MTTIREYARIQDRIAEALAESHPETGGFEGFTPEAQWYEVYTAIADALESENPDFNREGFSFRVATLIGREVLEP